MNSAESGTNATFYHYRLLKKVALPKSFSRSYMVLPFIWLAAEVICFSWTSIFFFLLAIPVSLWIQYVIARSILIIAKHSYRKRWRFTVQSPWIGYMPDHYVGYSIFRKVHFQSLWIGLCIIVVLLPWSPISFGFSLFFWHIWLIAPRFYALSTLRGQRKDGMLKISQQEISYYMQ